MEVLLLIAEPRQADGVLRGGFGRAGGWLGWLSGAILLLGSGRGWGYGCGCGCGGG